jgi:hypothetical protein
MSTRASIFEKTEDGGYRGIYLHWDGYPSHAGEILKNHYDTPEKVSALIDLGDLSSIGSSLGPKSPEAGKDPCVSYHREFGAQLRIEKTLQPRTRLGSVIRVEYTYVFEDGSWTFDKNR